MNAIPDTASKENFATPIDTVCRTPAPTVITRKQGQETAYLLRSPVNAKRLLKSIEHLNAKRGVPKANVFLVVIGLLGSSFPAQMQAASAPEAAEIAKPMSWTKSGQGRADRQPSRLDDLTAKEREKTFDLDRPVTVTVLKEGATVQGLEEVSERIVLVRIANPNPYPIFFQGRQYREYATVKASWKAWADGAWKEAGWDWCGTRVRDWVVEPGGTREVLLTLHRNLERQQIFARFHREDKPSIQSDCLLYEKKEYSLSSRPKR